MICSVYFNIQWFIKVSVLIYENQFISNKSIHTLCLQSTAQY